MTNDQPIERVVHTRDVASNESLTQTVVNAVATVSGADPVPDPASGGDVLEPLYTIVDTEALESVFRSTGSESDRADGRISFSYHGCDVTIRGGSRVTVERPESRANGAAD